MWMSEEKENKRKWKGQTIDKELKLWYNRDVKKKIKVKKTKVLKNQIK